MEAYPEQYVAHNLPLIVLSGLGETALDEKSSDSPPWREGAKITSELPTITGERAEQLLGDFLKADGSDLPWNNRASKVKGGLLGFKFKTVGRVGQAPGFPRSLLRALTIATGLHTACSKG